MCLQDLESPLAHPQTRGRIAIYCTCEGFDRPGLQAALEAKGPNWLMHKYADCLYGKYAAPGIEPLGDCFFFDYGCVAFWGLNIKQVCFSTSGAMLQSAAATHQQAASLQLACAQARGLPVRQVCCAGH